MLAAPKASIYLRYMCQCPYMMLAGPYNTKIMPSVSEKSVVQQTLCVSPCIVSNEPTHPIICSLLTDDSMDFFCILALFHSWLNHSISVWLKPDSLNYIYIELYLNHIPVCYFVRPYLKKIIFVSVENCGTNRALIFSIVLCFFVDENVCFCVVSCPVQFMLYFLKNEARFLHTISSCFSTNRYYLSH